MATRKAIRLILLITLFVALIPAMPIATGAPTQDYPVCAADYSQTAPRVDGDRVIWVDERNRSLGGSWNSDIYMYDFTTGEESQLTSSTLEQSWAEISGDWVVYYETDGTFGNSALRALDVSTQETADVWVGVPGSAQRPRIDGDIIVWEYSPPGWPSDFDVLAYDLSSDTTFTVAGGYGDQRFPVVGGGKVIYTTSGGWWSYDLATTTTTELTNVPAGVSVTCTEADDQHWLFIASPDGSTNHLYVMDLATSVVETLATSAEPYGAGDENVDIDGDLITYQAEPPGPYMKSYVYSLSSGTDQLVSSYDSDQAYPHVSGSTIVWRDMRNYPGTGENYYDIYTNRLIDVGPLPATTASGIPDGWYSGDVEVTLEVTPTASTIYYDIDGSGTAEYTAPLVFGSTEGTHTLEYWGVNVAGEESPHHFAEVKIDKSPPSTDHNISKSPYVGSAVVTLQPDDTYSGVAETLWRLDGGVWRSGTTVYCSTIGLHTLEYFSVDNVGIKEDVRSGEFSIEAAASPGFTPVQGDDRYKTAVAASKQAFPDGIVSPDPEGYRTAVVATGQNWPDALGAASLAGALGGPILLTRSDSLPTDISAEIFRLGADRVIVVGGTGAVSAAVESALSAVDGVLEVERIAGGGRYDTARLVAQRAVSLQGFEYSGYALVTTGQNFPDALAASPIAAHAGWPVYLMGNAAQDVATADQMAADGVTNVFLIGGTKALPPSVETVIKDRTGLIDDDLDRLPGGSRYETGAMVAQMGVEIAGLFWDGVALATGDAFPDALAGGVMQGRLGSPVLLTTSAALHAEPEGKLVGNAAFIDEVRYLGGTKALSPAVRDRVSQIIN